VFIHCVPTLEDARQIECTCDGYRRYTLLQRGRCGTIVKNNIALNDGIISPLDWIYVVLDGFRRALYPTIERRRDTLKLHDICFIVCRRIGDVNFTVKSRRFGRSILYPSTQAATAFGTPSTDRSTMILYLYNIITCPSRSSAVMRVLRGCFTEQHL